MESQGNLPLFTFFLLTLVTLTLSAPVSETSSLDPQASSVVDTCHACGQAKPNDPSDVLKRKLLLLCSNVMGKIHRALNVLRNKYEISRPSASDRTNGMISCCGYASYVQNMTGLPHLSKGDLVSHAMLILQDVVSMTGQKSYSLDQVVIKQLKEMLCLLETIDVKYKAQTCHMTSPMKKCPNNNSLICALKMTESFLMDASVLLNKSGILNWF